MDFREIIKAELRRQKSQGLKISNGNQLAYKIEMSPNTVYAYLSGKRDIKTKTLQKMLKALNIKI